MNNKLNKLNKNSEILLEQNILEMNKFREMPFESQYILALKNILINGTTSKDRTGVGTKRIQSQQIHCNLQDGFPIVRSKQMGFKTAFVEFMWILSGKNDLKFLKENGVNYWDEWVKEDGTFGPIYGPQMRNFSATKIHATDIPGFDQLEDTVRLLREVPDSRRIIVDLWNPNDLKSQSLPPCHLYYQASSFINNEGIRVIDLHVTQRSADSFLGVPYDFMLFAFYLHYLSLMTGYEFGIVHCNFNDFHMYLNHEEQLNQIIYNYVEDPKGLFDFDVEKIPTISVSEKFKDVDFTSLTVNESIELIMLNKFDLFVLNNYSKENRYDKIEAEVAV